MKARNDSGEASSSGLVTTTAGSFGRSAALRATSADYRRSGSSPGAFATATLGVAH
jgi:hypothetical protein